MCCDHHIGTTFVSHLVRCRKVCDGLLKGVRNDENGDYEKYGFSKKDTKKKN